MTTQPPIGLRAGEAMTPAQRAAHDVIASGPRSGVPLPFLAMLDAPELATAIQQVGSVLRFSGTLSPALREVAILSAAAAFGSGYEWDYHLPLARAAGVSERTITAAARGQATTADDPTCAAIVALCHAAVKRQSVPPADLARIVADLGRQAASEVVAIAGYYPLLAIFLAAARVDHPVTDGGG